MPVYNVDKYLRKAVTSILTQTYQDFEVILINDGSSDNSLSVAKELAQNDSRIIIYSQRNSGAAEARNKGIELSSGKYLYFMDPDDWAKEALLKDMFKTAEKYSLELVISGFTNVYQESEKTHLTTKVLTPFKIYLTSESFRKKAYIYLNNTQLAVPWNKLYLASYIKNKKLKFPKIRWDDLHFNLEVVKKISKVGIIENTDYQFLRTRPGSETTKVFDKELFEKRKEQFKHVLSVYSYWFDGYSNISGQVYYYFASRCFQIIQETIGDKNLNYIEKKNYTAKILNDSLVRKSLERENSSKGIMKFVLYFMKKRYITLLFIVSSLVSFLKNKFAMIFYKLRVRLMRV
jgi:glycosyltransferase involved in cell wall biosynthesis